MSFYRPIDQPCGYLVQLLTFGNTAGSRKTVLASSIIQEIQSQSLGTLVYVYFSFNEDVDDLHLLQCTILTQIVSSLSTSLSDRKDRFFIPRACQKLYEKYTPANHPTLEHLKLVFNAILDESGSTYIVIDALDECPKDLASTPTHNLHVIITSRDEEDIENAMSEAQCNTKLFISFPVDQVNEDIRKHLLNCVASAPYNKWTEGIKDKVVGYLTKNADGVFRWADLQLIQLEGKHKAKDVFKLLERLPKGFDDTYTRMLSLIDDIHQMEALSVLRWLAFSKRLLLLSETNEIAACAPLTGDDNAEVAFTLDNRFPYLSDIRNMLCGLITVDDPDSLDSGHSSRQSLPRTESKLQIFLAHSSIKGYLLKGSGIGHTFRLTPASSHWFIVKTCLAYIRYYDIECNEEDSRAAAVPYALLRYACKFVWAHFETLVSELDGPLKERRIQELKRIEEGHDGTAFQFSKRLKDNNVDCPSHSHFTTRHRALPGSPIQLDAGNSDDLHVASHLGEVEVVKLLLDAGMDIDGQDSSKRTPLHFAASNGQLDTVKEWISQRCAVDPYSASGCTPLLEAAAEGHANIVAVLLKHGSDATKDTTSFRGTDRDSELFRLDYMPPDEIQMFQHVRVLGCPEVGFLAKVTSGLGPLHYAARNGRKEVVDTLLQNGIDIEYTSYWGQTALSIAAAEGQIEITRMLIERGAKVSATLDCGISDHPYSPLHVAAVNWQPGNVEVLVKSGVDVHETGGPLCSSALHLAAIGTAKLAATLSLSQTLPETGRDKSKAVDTVRELLEGGAQVNERDGNGNTVLHISAMCGRADIMDVLLEKAKYADIDSLGDTGWAPLHHSACRGFTKIVQGLLIKGADPDIRSGESQWTPLIMASGCGHLDTVRVLVESGASIGKADSKGHTALHAAALKRHEDVYRFLVENGGEPGVEDHDGETAESIMDNVVEIED